MAEGFTREEIHAHLTRDHGLDPVGGHIDMVVYHDLAHHELVDQVGEPDHGHPGWPDGDAENVFRHPLFGEMPGYRVGRCGHRVAASEWRAGFRVCEHCDPADHPLPVPALED